MSELRYLTLVNAVGSQLRTALFQERPHLIVPLTVLIGDEVVHAANSDTPEFVPAEEIRRGYMSWCGRPVVGDHPQVDGRYVSANPAHIADRHAFGRIDNPRFIDGRMILDAWIDRARAERLGGDALSALQRAEKNEPIEVSVGVEVEVEDKSGVAPNGKKYVGIWRDLQGDHIALLPPGATGACSNKMGCGVRAMRHMVSAEGLSLVDEPAVTTPVTPPSTIVHEKPPPPSSSKESAMTVADRLKALLAKLTVADVGTEDDTSREIAAEVDVEQVEELELVTELIAAAGKRHSASDQKMLQTVHDHAVSLGAECAQKEPKAASCGCAHNRVDDANKETKMDKPEERVAALIKSGKFNEGDRAWLTAVPAERLAVLEASVADTEKKDDEKKDDEKKDPPAEPKLPEGVVAIQAEELQALRAMAAREQERDRARHAELLVAIKATKQDAYSDADLKAMKVSELERVAKLAKATPKDHSARFVPSLAPEGEPQVIPPPPSMEKSARAMRGLSNEA